MTSQRQQRPLRILVVDDDRDVASSQALVLRLWGHVVEAATGSSQAFELAERLYFDVVLLDLAMPGMDGFALARALQDILPNRPLLLAVSGYGADAEVQRCRAAGFDQHFLKPVDLSRLERVLNEFSRVKAARTIEHAFSSSH